MELLDAYGGPYKADKILCSLDIGEREGYEQRILELAKKTHAVDIIHFEYDSAEHKAASWYTLRSM